jgi:bifunctional non-homologous end joining protein LigD
MPGVKQFKQSLDPDHPPMLEVPSGKRCCPPRR